MPSRSCWLKLLLNDEPMTPTMLTSATPIISAAAVVAVRLGLRAALPFAKRPVTP